MNAFDVGVTILAAAGVLFGLVKGLARILIGVASLVVAFLIASHFQDPVAAWLVRTHVAPAAAQIVAYLAIFLATMLAGGVVAWLVGKILKLAMLSWADRFAGGAIGLLAALLAAAFVVHPIVASTSWGAPMLRGSALAPYVTVVSDLANVGVPEALAAKYRKEVETLRGLWREARERETSGKSEAVGR